MTIQVEDQIHDIDENVPHCKGCDCLDCCVDPDMKPFIRHIERLGFERIDIGSFREVFLRKGVVIKVPWNDDGMLDNMVEARAWRKYRNRPTTLGLQLAPCRLLPNGCLMMVTVKFLQHEKRPDWAEMVDSKQVGRYKDRVVAYDYALDLPERVYWEKEWDRDIDSFFHNDWIVRHSYLKDRADEMVNKCWL